MIGLTVLPYGEQAVLLELDHAEESCRCAMPLLAKAHPGIRAVRPAACTVLLEFDPAVVSTPSWRG